MHPFIPLKVRPQIPTHSEITMHKYSQPGFRVPVYIAVPMVIVLVAASPAILVYINGKETVADWKKKKAMKRERKRVAEKAAEKEEVLDAGDCESAL